MLFSATMVKGRSCREYTHVGVPCGIMDQTIAVRARAGRCVAPGVRQREFRHIPVRGRFLLVDYRGASRPDASPYNSRRASVKRPWPCSRRTEPGVAQLADWRFANRALARLLPRRSGHAQCMW